MYPYLQVDTAALRHNAAEIKKYVGVPVIGVVKCDGYGVSVAAAARAWMSAGVNMLAISQPKDAEKLRKCGFGGDILLLSPVTDRKLLHKMLHMQVILPVTSLQTAKLYSESCHTPVRVHVAVDTGMGRFGIHWAEREIFSEVYQTDNLRFDGIYSHFAASFEKRFRKTAKQLDRFLDLCSWLKGEGYSIGIRHIANSCAALRFPQTRLDAVRIGSALVGQLCAKTPLRLLPAAVCKAPVLEQKCLLPGDTTGYASLCRIRRQTNTIIVGVGHECGVGLLKTPEHYPLKAMAGYLLRLLRQCWNPPCVYYAGKPLKLVGRLGNQFSLFDAGDLSVEPGAYVDIKPNLLFPWKRRRFL